MKKANEEKLNDLLQEVGNLEREYGIRFNWGEAIGNGGWGDLRREHFDEDYAYYDESVTQYKKWKDYIVTKKDIDKLRKGKIKTLKVIGPFGKWKQVVTLTPDDPRLKSFSDGKIGGYGNVEAKYTLNPHSTIITQTPQKTRKKSMVLDLTITAKATC